MRRRALLGAALCCAIAVGAAHGASSLPVARADTVVDVYHGVRVADPYRWMESSSEEFDTWVDGQAAYARDTLTRLPGRDSIRDVLERANRGTTRVIAQAVRGTTPRIFLLKRAPEDPTPRVWVREGWTGPERLLVDPGTRGSDSVHYAVDAIAPSWDGRYLAYGMSASGSEDSAIEVLDVDSGRLLADRIDRAQYASISWRADNRSFFYWRRRAPAPGAARADWFRDASVHLHVLGDDPDTEPPVFGSAVASLGLTGRDFSAVLTSPQSPWAIAYAYAGSSAPAQWFVARAESVGSGVRSPWRRIAEESDRIDDMCVHGDSAYALSFATPNGSVIAVHARTETVRTGHVVVPETARPLRLFLAARDGLYLFSVTDHGGSHIERMTWDARAQRDVARLPFSGAVRDLASDLDRDGVRFNLAGWFHFAEPYAYDPAGGVRSLGLVEAWPASYDDLAATETEVTSADGTRVPLTILHRHDALFDGSSPAILTGYAAYGISAQPTFAPMVLAWVGGGGVYAVAHARGGGERGDAWHLAGSVRNKERGYADVVACAEHLLARGYTRASRLTLMGTSAGGLLVGGTMTRRPDLFAAAILRVPCTNLLRFELTEGGPANVPEFGTVSDSADFRAMYAADPYHRIRDRVRYPAVLCTTGLHDVRVPVWQPAKFVARLQSHIPRTPALLRVEADAGHGLGSTASQLVEEYADLFAFALWASRR